MVPTTLCTQTYRVSGAPGSCCILGANFTECLPTLAAAQPRVYVTAGQDNSSRSIFYVAGPSRSRAAEEGARAQEGGAREGDAPAPDRVTARTASDPSNPSTGPRLRIERLGS